jgi:glycine dehydrogenase subunit 1
LAEAVLMSLRITQRKKILLSRAVHPEYRQTLATYLSGLDVSCNDLDYSDKGTCDIARLKSSLDDDTSCVVLASPNFFGLIEDIDYIKEALGQRGIHLILVTNPMALAILKEPHALGVDIVCGDGQVFGNTMSFGGPSFGFLATRNDYLRQLPGRLVGKTVDGSGHDAYCLTLQTREQHIRREKATSNICSNQSLNAIAAAMYLSLVGKEGLRKVALFSMNLAHYMYDALKTVKGVSIPFGSNFFNEFVWGVEPVRPLFAALSKERILCGVPLEPWYPDFKNAFVSACTEKKSVADIDQFIVQLKKKL